MSIQKEVNTRDDAQSVVNATEAVIKAVGNIQEEIKIAGKPLERALVALGSLDTRKLDFENKEAIEIALRNLKEVNKCHASMHQMTLVAINSAKIAINIAKLTAETIVSFATRNYNQLRLLQ